MRGLTLVHSTVSPGSASTCPGANAENCTPTATIAATASAIIAAPPDRSRPDVAGTGATHESCAPAPPRALQRQAAPPAPGRQPACARSADDDLGLHPRVDQAHEAQRRALLRRDGEVDRLALLARSGDARVSQLVHVRRRVLPDAVLEVLELRRRVAVRVSAVRGAELLADRATEDLLRGARQILAPDDGERVRAFVGRIVDDV